MKLIFCLNQPLRRTTGCVIATSFYARLIFVCNINIKQGDFKQNKMYSIESAKVEKKLQSDHCFFDDEDEIMCEIVFESDNDESAPETVLPLLQETTIAIADDNAGLVFESSDDEEIEPDTILPPLNSVHCNASVSVCNPKRQSITLETIIPPALTPKEMKRMFVAKTITKHGSAASIVFDVARGYSSCKLTTTINTSDVYGIYWCPYPKCNMKSRKRWLMRDHLRKTHHWPFYCAKCGFFFNHLTSLTRHLSKSGHLRYSDLSDNEEIRRHTAASIERFSVHICQVFSSAPDHILFVNN